VVVFDGPVTGEARVRGPAYMREVRALAEARAPRPVCVVSSGETTVHVTGTGRGGRNQEFALAALPELAAFRQPVCLASVGTDGVDGPTDAAGALADSGTLDRAAVHGLDPMRYLEANDAWSFFDALGDLVRTGATSTNVGDLQVALVDAPVGA
jgi:hydroxypyruvate reductase